MELHLGHFNHLYLAYTAYVLAALSPGPSNMAIMGAAMSRGRKAALALTAGVVTGSWTWAVLASTGLSTILLAYTHGIFFIKIAGAIYLLYLAYRAAQSSLRQRNTPDLDDEARPVRTEYRMLYRRGFLLHIGNPKAIMGWIATISLGIQPDGPAYIPFAILAGCAVLSVTIFGGYALVFSMPTMVRLYKNAERWIEGTLAVFFGIAGLRLLLWRS